MTKSELNELKQMTGLVSEAELSNNNDNKPAAAAAPAHITIKRKEYTNTTPSLSTLREQYVGKYVRVDDVYGMIDDVHGDRLGFVHSGKDYWAGELVYPFDVDECANDDELAKAKASALGYFEREQDSLNARIAMRLPKDNYALLSHALWKINKWLEKLAA